jgi:hypothetical protein
MLIKTSDHCHLRVAGHYVQLRYITARKVRRALVGCSVIAAVCFIYKSFDRGRETEVHGIRVSGDEKFNEQVQGALNLLHDKSPSAFSLTERYVKRIEQSARSGMRADADPPTFDLAPKTAFYSVSWCAGSIAHDTFHSKLYHEYVQTHGKPVPFDAWCGQAREMECIKFQIGVLKEIGAPEYEITYTSQLDGSHYKAKVEW